MTILDSSSENVLHMSVRRLRAVPVLAIVIVGCLLRLVALSARPLWYDEAYTVMLSEHGVIAMLEATLTAVEGVASDVHPPGYYALLFYWMRLFGQSPAAIRMLSVLAGTGLIFVAYWLTRLLFDVRIGRWAAVFVALSPFQLHYAQETRMYVLLALLLIGATGVFYLALKNGSRHLWIFFAVLAALAQYAHHLAFIFLVPLAMTPVWTRDWRAVRPVLVSGLGALFLYLPWLVQMPAQLSKVHKAYWTTRPGVERLVTVALTYVTNLPLEGIMLVAGLSITLLTLSVAVWQTVLAIRMKSAHFRAGLWMAYLAFVPVTLLFVISQVQPVFIERALVPSGVAFLIWLAWALLSAPSPRFVRVTMVILVFAGMGIGICQHFNYRGFPYADFERLAQRIEADTDAGVLILHSNKLSALPAIYYNREVEQRYLADPPGSGSDTLALPTQRVINQLAYRSMAEAVGRSDQVLFIIFSKALDEYQSPGGNAHPHLAWFEPRYDLMDIEVWEDLLLYRYERK